MRGVAINVGANTGLPGFRGPVYPDGSFRYIPIPERESTRAPVPTYADLDIDVSFPDAILDRRVHLDPTFAEYPHCSAYTYGDEHAVKAGPLSDLRTGDIVLFYATLTTQGDPNRDWIAPDWGAYAIGHFQLAEQPVTDGHSQGLTDRQQQRYATNAHLKRETMDARVLLFGAPATSQLYDVAIPLSDPSDGNSPGKLVLEHTTDSGRGPWWRRPLRIPDPAPILDRR